MTTNLKITPNRKGDIKANGNTLTFTLASPLKAWNNEAVGNGEFDLIGEGFPIDNNVYNSVDSQEIKRVEIQGVGDDESLTLSLFFFAALLKGEVKSWGNQAQNIWDFELTLDKDLTSQTDHWNITPPSGPGTNDRILKLTAADFGGALDKSKISISDTEYHTEPNHKIKIVQDRSPQKQALLDLYENLLNLSKYFEKDKLKVGPDGDLPLTLIHTLIGDPPSPTDPVPKTGLWSYVSGQILNFDIPKEPNNVKQALYNLSDEKGEVFFEEPIKNALTFFETLKVLRSGGITKKSQFFLIFGSIFDEAEGHEINEEENIEEIMKEPGFYKGFLLLDPNLRIFPNPAKGNQFETSKIDPNKPSRGKFAVDNFRNFATDYTGPNAEVFTKTKTSKNKTMGKGVQVYANRLPEELLGFQPGDIYLSNDDKLRYHNSGKTFRGVSKIVEDIWNAQNVNEALDLAFYGKDYDEPQSQKAIRKGNPTLNALKKHPNVNLKFNEVKGQTRLEHLERYYEALKDGSKCEWLIPGDATGAGAKHAPDYDDPETKKKIDEGYNLAQKFITDYENLISVNISNLNKTQLEEAKTKLEKWQTTRFYTSGGAWQPVIDDFLSRVNDVLINFPNDFPDNPPPLEMTQTDGRNWPIWKMAGAN